MNTLPDESPPTAGMRLRWEWRPYQLRVIAELNRHLDDRRLHLVAAPGSGKTTLGLEIFRRLGRPAIAFSPTITICNQWIRNLADFFPAGSPTPPAWASVDLSEPRYFTSTTYQALHTRYRNDANPAPPESDDSDAVESGDENTPTPEELQSVTEILRRAEIGTVILDEAHHLRQAWWKVLAELIQGLDDVVVVSLTATPPYDVLGSEWKRYEELCGPIDAEISVPELVRSGALCPHQDYVYAVRAESAGETVRNFDLHVAELLAQLPADEEFAADIRSHPWFGEEPIDPAQVLEDPELASALLVYARKRGDEASAPLLELLDCDDEDIPEWNRRWCEILLREYLFGKRWEQPQERKHRTDLLAIRLRRDGLLWRRELRIQQSRAIERLLSLAPEKIDACVEICRREWSLRADQLRQVILTDFIADEGLQTGAASSSLGAWPLFRRLAMELADGRPERLALLTGRLVVIHNEILEQLGHACQVRGVKFNHSRVAGITGFLRLDCPGSGLVEAITSLLRQGRIQVIVGTRALLGEGWNAPSVNSLIIASSAGTYVQTNQMRGRAFRSDSADPNKAATIWHITAIASGDLAGLSDFDGLAQRFRSFVGLAETRQSIENGLARLELDRQQMSLAPEQSNAAMFQRLEDLGKLAERWRAAIEAGSRGAVVPVLESASPKSFRRYLFASTLANLLYSAMWTFTTVATNLLRGLSRDSSSTAIMWGLLIASGAGLLASFPKLIRSATVWIRHLPVDGSMRQIALALFDAHETAGVIQRGPGSSVAIEALDGGRFSVVLHGVSYYEQQVYTGALAELLEPIENPRYMIVRTDTGRRFADRDYHAVPAVLASQKERAEIFLAAWRQRLGMGELIYTRTPEGRRELLRARAKAFSSAFAESTERWDRWQ